MQSTDKYIHARRNSAPFFWHDMAREWESYIYLRTTCYSKYTNLLILITGHSYYRDRDKIHEKKYEKLNSCVRSFALTMHNSTVVFNVQLLHVYDRFTYTHLGLYLQKDHPNIVMYRIYKYIVPHARVNFLIQATPSEGLEMRLYIISLYDFAYMCACTHFLIVICSTWCRQPRASQ